MAGAKWCVAFHRPGPLHEGNGTLKPYFDSSLSQEQIEAIGQILSGQNGCSRFEVVESIVTAVKDAAIVPIDFHVEGRTGTITLGERTRNSFAPMRNPATCAEETVRVAIPGGMEYTRGDGVAEILTSRTLRSTDEIAFDHTCVHTSLVEQRDQGGGR